MQKLLPPICLILAVALLIAGFALWAAGPPQESMDLHRARVAGDEPYTELLEARLDRRRLARKLLLGCLFGGSALMTLIAFLTMQPTR